MRRRGYRIATVVVIKPIKGFEDCTRHLSLYGKLATSRASSLVYFRSISDGRLIVVVSGVPGAGAVAATDAVVRMKLLGGVGGRTAKPVVGGPRSL